MKKNILSLSGILVASLLFGGCAATQSIDEFAYKYSPENVGKTLRDSLSGKNQDGFTKTFDGFPNLEGIDSTLAAISSLVTALC